MSILDDMVYLTWLKDECGYLGPRPLLGGRWAAIMPMMFTCAIVVGRIGDMTGYDDRWCYSNFKKAKAAFDAWGGDGEPDGWHRHPASGRRREGGNAELEIIAP